MTRVTVSYADWKMRREPDGVIIGEYISRQGQTVVTVRGAFTPSAALEVWTADRWELVPKADGVGPMGFGAEAACTFTLDGSILRHYLNTRDHATKEEAADANLA